MGLSSGFNLPPGVFESDLPGNRPEDMAYERYVEGLDDEEILDFFENERCDAAGLVLYKVEDRSWFLETPGETPELVFTSRDEALGYVLAFHDQDLIETMGERYLEDPESY